MPAVASGATDAAAAAGRDSRRSDSQRGLNDQFFLSTDKQLAALDVLWSAVAQIRTRGTRKWTVFYVAGKSPAGSAAVTAVTSPLMH